MSRDSDSRNRELRDLHSRLGMYRELGQGFATLAEEYRLIVDELEAVRRETERLERDM